MNNGLLNGPKLKLLLILGLAVLATFIVVNIVRSSQFGITKTEPGTRPFPNSLGLLEVYFNKQLDSEYINNQASKNIDTVAKVSFGGDNTLRAEDNKLVITFQKTPASGEHTIELKDIRAKSGASISKKLVLDIKDVPYEELSKRGKELADQTSVEGETPPVNLPVVRDLPYQTDNYLIDYRPIEDDVDGNSPVTLVITMKFFKPGSNAGPASPEEMQTYINNVRKYRNEALAWLRSKGYKLDDYLLEYPEQVLQNEFPATLKTPCQPPLFCNTSSKLLGLGLRPAA